MKKQLLFLVSTMLWATTLFAQNTLYYNSQPGTAGYTKDDPIAMKVADGNSTIATSYTQTACGLNYAVGSVFLAQRNATVWPGAAVQPAPIVISGMPPATCQNILKAFLYVSTSGNGIPITATVTNPQSVSASFSMTQIGQGVNLCWNYLGSYTYRADVTSVITGNGTYSVSGIPAAPTGTNNQGNDAHGATLFIIYGDNSQTYSGSIIIADGNAAHNMGGTKTCTIGGFNVCGAPNSTSNFMLVADFQKIAPANIALNSATSNYSLPASAQMGYNWINDPGAPASVGQSTANYSASSGTDCFAIILAGMYFRTSCLTCTLAQNAPTVSVNTSSNPICQSQSATLTASGSSNYTWSTNSNASSIVVSPTVNTTYIVWSANGNGCGSSSLTQSVSICNNLNENARSSGIKLYPNPSNGQFKIYLKEELKNIDLLIYNSIGQLIIRKEIRKGENTIDVSMNAKGYYYAVISENEKVIFREKIIVE